MSVNLIFRSFEIVFEVINGEHAGYVAIDDVVYSDCADRSSGQPCGASSFACGNGDCIFLDEVKNLFLIIIN